MIFSFLIFKMLGVLHFLMEKARLQVLKMPDSVADEKKDNENQENVEPVKA